MQIENYEEFAAWLEKQSRQTCALVAARAALRVYPYVLSIKQDKLNLSLIAVRAVLTAMVAAKMPSSEVRNAAAHASNVVQHSVSAAGRANVAHNVQKAVSAAGFAAYAVAIYSNTDPDPAHAARTVYFMASEVSVSTAGIGVVAKFAFADAETDPGILFSKPIWHTPGEPNWLETVSNDRVSFYDEDLSWAFWREWYQGFLDGKPLDWELQRRVALIPNPIWEAGPEAVAEEIAQIRAEYLADKTPQAERVEFNPETAKFFTVPIEVAKPDLLGATLTQVEDALEDALANPSNGLHDNSREVRVLRRIANKYGNDPQQIEMGFVSVHAGLTRQMLSDELPPSEENLALQAAVEEGARAIRATHPEVAENRKILSEQVIRELPDGAKEKLQEALPVLRAISEPELADDWEHDIPTLINDATTPLPSGAPALPGADEATRIFSRVAKISLHLKAANVIHKVDGSAGYKAARIIATIAALVALGINIL